MPPFSNCQYVEDGTKRKCGVHDAPVCEQCLKEWVAKQVEEKLTSTNKSSFQFPKLEEVHKHVESKVWCGSISDIKFNLTNEIYTFIFGNKKH